MSLARQAAYDALLRHETKQSHARQSLDEVFRGTRSLSKQDKAFCRELVYGAVQRMNTLDWALDLFSQTPVRKLPVGVLSLLRLGAYQLLFMEERVPAYAAVNECVDLAKNGGGRGGSQKRASFVNAVLRKLERERRALPWPKQKGDEVRALALSQSHPEWLVRRWLDRWGPAECAALLKKNNEVPPFSVRVNTLKTSREDLRSSLHAQNIESDLSVVSPEGLRFRVPPSLFDLDAFQKGLFTVQDEASQVAVQVLDPQPNETVMDLCAAPGGKTTHIAERMHGSGEVLAFDVTKERVALIKEACDRLGLKNTRPQVLDGKKVGQEYSGRADRVLLDAPCSGLGILRRRPDLRWNKRPENISQLPALQRELLASAGKALKKGGVIVYSTCTTEPEENQGAIASFLANHRDFHVESAVKWIPKTLSDAITPEGFVQLLPHRHDTDGFFIARLRKAAT